MKLYEGLENIPILRYGNWAYRWLLWQIKHSNNFAIEENQSEIAFFRKMSVVMEARPSIDFSFGAVSSNEMYTEHFMVIARATQYTRLVGTT